jgi:choline dehydrogenase
LRSEAFDFVIIGAGTAGCVLANRLSADPQTTVCLLESGPADTYLPIHVPPLIGMAIQNPKLNWGFSTAPQTALGNRPVIIPRGRVLGGSSSINGMVYFRGHPGDFDDWAAAGNPGWGYADVLPYFVRSENNEAYRNSVYHGTGGPMNVMSIGRPNPLVHRFVEATTSLGLPANADFNAADPEGFGTRQATIRNGRRVSAATAFLNPAKRRGNLTVMTHSDVARIVIDGGRATGVDIRRAGTALRIGARREVLLCAGAYSSPAVLMHSGIGDGAALAALGIKVEHHLPEVGRNLRDHPSAEVRMQTRSIEPYGLTWRALPRNMANFAEYVVFRKGPISSNVFEGTGFTRSRPDLARPDLQMVMMPAARTLKPLPLEHGYGIIAIASRPKSRGAVTLASSDPATAPVIDPHYLEHPDDMATLVFGLQLARKILAAQPFEKYAGTELVPGIECRETGQLEQYIRRTAASVHHPSSTCRMGGDPQSVVDPSLRVRGIAGLRVIDASIMPTLVAGNTNAAVVMIAEKGADLVLGRNPPAPIDANHAP